MSTTDSTDDKTVIVTEMRESTREGIRDALVEYYSGRSPSYTDAFTKTPGIARDTYYRYKREQPDVIAEIDDDARQIASRGRDSVAIAVDSKMLLKSYEIQHEAANVLESIIPTLASIARREPHTIVIGENKDGSDKIKVMLPYGRDAIAAAGIIHDIARHGVLPEQVTRMMTTVIEPIIEVEVLEEPDGGLMLPLLGKVDPNFSSVTAITPDGTEYTATVKRGEVLEAEVDEA